MSPCLLRSCGRRMGHHGDFRLVAQSNDVQVQLEKVSVCLPFSLLICWATFRGIIYLPTLLFKAFRYPFFGPRGGRDLLNVHVTPESEHTPHCGRILSHRSFRLLHSSHAEPGFCRDRDGSCSLSSELDDCEYMLGFLFIRIMRAR